ncbi:MAG: hypothetical protein CMH56_12670 [Myxococcales bacterium]|nr:hypothetical protein [Myxococcales bacterium]
MRSPICLSSFLAFGFLFFTASSVEAKKVNVPSIIKSAVRDGVTVKNAKIAYRSYRSRIPAKCHLRYAQVDRAINRSGRVLVKTTGHDNHGVSCQGWAWVSIQLKAKMWVATRPVQNGALLEGNFKQRWREIKNGRLPYQGNLTDKVANRYIPKASPIRDNDVRALGPEPGSDVTVVVQAQAIQIKQKGRAVPCNGSLPCAVLPSGKKVRGSYENDTLYVEVH